MGFFFSAHHVYDGVGDLELLLPLVAEDAVDEDA